MIRLCGFVLALFCCACHNSETIIGKWDGTYIGYMHQNRQDTLPLTLVLEGRRFAAAPALHEASLTASGDFYEQESRLVFNGRTHNSPLQLDGVYQYDFGMDGSLRIWQDNGNQLSELILLQK